MAPGRLSPSVTLQCFLAATALLLFSVTTTLATTTTIGSESEQISSISISITEPTPVNVNSNSTGSDPTGTANPPPGVASSRAGEVAQIRIIYDHKGTKGEGSKSKSPKEKARSQASKEASKPKSEKLTLSQSLSGHKYATIEPLASGAVSRVRVYAGKGKVAPRPRPPHPPHSHPHSPPRPKLIIRPRPPPGSKVLLRARPSGPGAGVSRYPHSRRPAPPPHSRPTPVAVVVPAPAPSHQPQPVRGFPPSGPPPLQQHQHPEPAPTPEVEVYVVSEEQVRNGPVILRSYAESKNRAPTPAYPHPPSSSEGGFSYEDGYPSTRHPTSHARPSPFPFEHEHGQHSSQSFKFDRPGSYEGENVAPPQSHQPPAPYQPQQQMPGELSDSFGLSSYDRRPPETDYTQGRDQPSPMIPTSVRSHDGTFMNMHGPIPGRNENGLVHPTYTKNYWLSGLAPPQVVLEDLKIIPDSVTLSGFSSGGGLAQQLLISYPSLFRGIAVFQQTYYRCGRGNGDINEFDAMCTSLGNHSHAYDPNIAMNDINAYFHNGLIEDPRLLRDKLLYLYVGLQNNVYRPEQMLNTLRIFEPHIGNRFRIRTRVQDAANLLPTDNFGGPCDASAIENHFLGNCNLNGPFEVLGFLLGEDIIKLPDETIQPDLNSLLEFDQTEFFEGIRGQHFMAPKGYMYVPDRCGPNGNQRCHFHIYFHGCRTGKDFNDGNHIRNSGFLQLAELNDVIVMFPQIQRHERNPLGCWDTYGNTGPLYATQKGVQVSIIRKMLARVLGGDGETNELVPERSASASQSTAPVYHHVS